MKQFILMLCISAFATVAMAQAKKADAVVKFAQTKHEFGKIKQGTPVTYDFVFSNSGNAPVVIETATASCGCTTPAWPKTPVMKNKTDKVSAGFNAASAGPFEKSIQVKVAGYDLPIELKISGEVLNSEDYAKFESTKPKKNG